MTALRMAAVAAAFGRDLEACLTTVERLIEKAGAAGVRLLALPEACLGGYLPSLSGPSTERRGEAGPPALSPDGPQIRRLIRSAGRMVVVAGYCEAGTDGRRYNSVVCVSGDGVLGNHRKVHLPLDEAASYQPGDNFHAFDTPVGRLGMMICYDKVFPESARTLALDGAQIGICVSAWPASRSNATPDLSEDHWTRRFDLFDLARALENQIVWLSANQVGTFGSLRFVGNAKIVGADGVVLAETGVQAGMAVAELDVPQALHMARRSINHLHDRRPDAYTPTTAAGRHVSIHCPVQGAYRGTM
jgi:predicted amidohydrolase